MTAAQPPVLADREPSREGLLARIVAVIDWAAAWRVNLIARELSIAVSRSGVRDMRRLVLTHRVYDRTRPPGWVYDVYDPRHESGLLADTGLVSLLDAAGIPVKDAKAPTVSGDGRD